MTVFEITSAELKPKSSSKLLCFSVDSPKHQFLIGLTQFPTHNTDEAKAIMALKGEAQSIIGSIARLGRAAGVHLLIATQRPDAKLLPGELKSNLGLRVACGQMNSTASLMTLDDTTATLTPSSPKGRGIVKTYSIPEKCQFYYADPSWIDGWLERRGMNPKAPDDDGTSGNNNSTSNTDKSGASEWDNTMENLNNA